MTIDVQFNMIYEMDNIQSILRGFDQAIQVSSISLSFIERLFPEYSSQPYFVLHKNVYPLEENKWDNAHANVEESQSALDITGSPLEYSFSKDNFDDTIILTKSNWRKEEENYSPLTRIAASNALNLCLANLDNQCRVPLFALCDGDDKEKTILLGIINDDVWFNTIQISSAQSKTVADVKRECRNRSLIQEHLNSSFAQEHDVVVSTFSIFEIFGTREDASNLDIISRNNYDGSLCIEVNTRTLSFDIPVSETCNKNLVVQVASGGKNSQLSELWKQLLLLDQYLRVLEKYKGKTSTTRYSTVPLEFPADFSTMYTGTYGETVNKLNSLLSGDLSFRSTSLEAEERFDDLEKCNLDHVDIKLKEHIEHLSSRPNIDFTDCLWELLIHVKNYAEMTDLFCTVFEKIIADGFQPELNSSSATRFTQTISDLQRQKTFSHILLGSLPLELVTDMGFEKLSRDYLYLLMNTKLIDTHIIREKFRNISHGEFKINLYRKRLMMLAQIHICLEIMLLIQNGLDCSNESLQSLFERAFKQYVSEESEIKDFAELQKSSIYTFIAPILHTNVIDEESSKGCPTVWRATLKSENEYSKFTTITYYSQANIIPPNISNCTSQDIKSEEEEFLYVTTAMSISSRCPAGSLKL